jgi:hypothetical protein
MLRTKLQVWCIVAATLTLTGCEDHLLQRDEATIGGKTIRDGREGPGGFKQNPGETYPYPEIIETEFIPPYEYFAYQKCRTWRITWPAYDSDYDPDLIPSVLSLNNGELNSFNYLNNTSPENTYNATLSLYYGSKVESASTMWDQLYYSFDAESMESLTFAKYNLSLKSIMHWVTERPKLFEQNWPGSSDNFLAYEEGDFILFNLGFAGHYGGVRIVSMTPRIIEVYLALPTE